jgi:two-component system, OmpR family, sensor histidine kinase KdpD
LINIRLNKFSNGKQYFISISFILAIATICYIFSNLIGYKVVALILLVSVSLVAMFFNILPVLITALLSALIWNFFFIPPKFTLHIDHAEDVLMFLMYFIIAMVNAVLTFKIRTIENIARKKEEKENTLKLYNTLLNSLSHELRTPIATIIVATDNLQSDNRTLTEENKSELIAEISKASLRLNSQVENLLNMSRLESGTIKLKMDWCDINELIYTTVNKLKEELGRRELIISIEENIPICKLDFGLMEQVLHNLITNANFYTSKSSYIKTTVTLTNDILNIIVEDNGNGFAPDELNFVFQKFYRSKKSSSGGTGLGLSIVKGFIEAHNGNIIVENIPDSGARFSIRIPVETSYINHLKNE